MRRLDLTLSQDLKAEFITELIYPAVQANCIYEVRPYRKRSIGDQY
jgi:argininosuccinate synthase